MPLSEFGPIVQGGAAAVMAFTFLWGVTKGIPMVMEAQAKQSAAFIVEVKEARSDFRDELGIERTFTREQATANRDAIREVTRAVERQTVATVAAAKDADVDEALATYGNGGRWVEGDAERRMK